MRKGCTALQNIQLLKWASELGIYVAWNFLAGFPGEDPQEYERMAAFIPALIHLQPPQGFGLIRLDRFSPYFNEPERYEIVNVRAASGYTRVYPFAPDVLRRLAYYFDYDFADGRDPSRYAASVAEQIAYWRTAYCPFGFTLIANTQALLLRDRRPQATQELSSLTGAERAVYEFLNAAHPFKAIQAHLEAQGYPEAESTLRSWLEEWVQKQWIVREGDWYLALAVAMNELL